MKARLIGVWLRGTNRPGMGMPMAYPLSSRRTGRPFRANESATRRELMWGLASNAPADASSARRPRLMLKPPARQGTARQKRGARGKKKKRKTKRQPQNPDLVGYPPVGTKTGPLYDKLLTNSRLPLFRGRPRAKGEHVAPKTYYKAPTPAYRRRRPLLPFMAARRSLGNPARVL